jgi:hypothetical protein
MPDTPDKENHPMLADLDITIWTVRDDSGAIVGEFRTEDEAFAYGSHLADANRDECYSVVSGRWDVPNDFQTPRPVA